MAGWRSRTRARSSQASQALQVMVRKCGELGWLANEDGALQGILESYDARDVKIVHAPCMRDGARCCVLDVRWSG